MEAILIIGFGLLLVAGFLIFRVQRRAGSPDSWRKLGLDLGLQYNEEVEHPQLTGSYKGTRVRVEIDDRDPAQRCTRYAARIPETMPKGLRVYLDKGLIVNGTIQDIEVGHDRFDQALIIQGEDEDKVRRMFQDPRIRGIVLTVARAGDGGLIDEHAIRVKVKGRHTRPSTVHRHLDLVVGAVEDLQRALLENPEVAPKPRYTTPPATPRMLKPEPNDFDLGEEEPSSPGGDGSLT